MASKEGLIADPVYEGRAVKGLLDLNAAGRFGPDANILLMHLGGTPAIHAYADQFGTPDLIPFNG
jgi:1-aminocyclopropane-1-carboxylate deaminase/D-cysteine desulfhydrase-like pyridoxal-dependent ACC family enzyme